MKDARLYLDHAATSFPKPACVRAAVLDYWDNVGASAGRGAYREAEEAGRLLAEARRLLAGLLRVQDESRIAFTLNCTDALNLALKGVLRAGDHVVTTWLDHNSILRPLARLEADGLIAVTRVPVEKGGCADPEAIKAAINPATRLVATLHASNVSGCLNDAKEIGRVCRERGVLFLLDAAQTLGGMPVYPGELGVDLLAFPGHKALMGPLGTGALYHSPGVEVRSVREGGTGSRSEVATQPGFLPDRLEAGSHNLPGIAGLAAAAGEALKAGLAGIASHKRQLTQRFLDQLEGVRGVVIHGPGDASIRVPVFSVTVAGMTPLQCAATLDSRFGIQVRAGLHCAPLAHRSLGTEGAGTVRISFGRFHTAEDVDRVCRALEQLSSRGWTASA